MLNYEYNDYDLNLIAPIRVMSKIRQQYNLA